MSEENKINQDKDQDEVSSVGQTFTAEEMEQKFPGFSEQLAKAKNKAEGKDEDDGFDFNGKHYTKKQIEWMASHPSKPPRQWTKAEKKARNKKNKAAAKMRAKNRKK